MQVKLKFACLKMSELLQTVYNKVDHHNDQEHIFISENDKVKSIGLCNYNIFNIEQYENHLIVKYSDVGYV